MSAAAHDATAGPHAAPRGASRSRPRVVVVGGGISGLAAAHRLVERAGDAVEPMLLEAADRLGGVIATERRDGFLIEGGPDSFVLEKPQAADLARRLGLGGELIPTNERFRRTLVVRDGRLVPLPEAFQLLAPARLLPFVRSPILSWPGKLRALADLVLPRGGPPPGGDESLASFVRRRLGDEVLERIAQPMVGGIYTADPETLSLASTMPRFLELERRHRSLILGLMRQAGTARPDAGTSGARFGLFATLRGGLGSLVEALVARLPAGSVRTGTRAVRVLADRAVGAGTGLPGTGGGREGGARFAIETSSGESIAADAVVIALPAPHAGAALREIDPALADEIAGIACSSAAVVNFAFRRADVPRGLDAFGVVVPEVERRAIVACSFSSVKYEGRAPADAVIVRAFVGGVLHPERYAQDDPRLVASARAELRSLLGIEAEPRFTRLHRWPESMPQYAVGHAARAARIRDRAARVAGLAIAGSAYDGVGLADCVRSGEAAAEAVLASMGLGAAAAGLAGAPATAAERAP
jgi:oxygen-dependent protoporphyrinogen oxidase